MVTAINQLALSVKRPKGASCGGSKKTEAGIIPEDWSVRLLPEVCRFQGGKAHEQFVDDAGTFVCVNSKFISSDGEVKKHCSKNLSPARRGDILMVMSDLPNGKALAKAFLVDEDGRYAVNQRVCSLTPYRDNPRYLLYVLSRNPYFLRFDDGVNQTHLLNPVFQKCPVALPPTIEEQEAIAEALDDAYALIESLGQLIAKKRAVKQGAMQNLLSGRTRLPGFTGEWKTQRLGEVVHADPENLGSNTNPDFAFKYISLEDVASGDLVGYTEHVFRTAPSRARRRLRKNDVLIGTVRPNLKSHLLFKGDEDDWICSTGFCVLRAKGQIVCPEYVYNHFFAEPITRQIDSLLAGSNYPAINNRDVRALEILIPPYEEQVAISTVLTELGDEIDALTRRLEKARQIKQGMMQELLTGRVRLV